MATKSAIRTKPRAKPRVKKRKPRWLRVLQIFGLLIFILSVAVALPAMFVWMNIYNDSGKLLGSIEDARAKLQVKPSIIKSADGVILYTIAAENRAWVMYKDIPAVVINATLAAEDKRFWEHRGVDIQSVGRQLWTNLRDKKMSGGASTLPMQLSKRLVTSEEKTWKRKLMDAATAMHIEQKYDKKDIIELYLNQVFYGERAYGIKAAADVYFNKPLEKLTIAEAALLARCVRRPSGENPRVNPTKALSNRDVVLKVMLEEGMITRQKYENSIKEPLNLTKVRKQYFGKQSAGYYVDYILEQLPKIAPDINIEDGGYVVETTIRTDIQGMAERELRRFVDRNRRNRITTGAFLVTNKDGEILAMVGGYDYKKGQFNVITKGRRQPGSSFKPFVYAMAIDTGGLGEYDQISNAPLAIRLGNGGYYRPKNSSGFSYGSVDTRTALQWSINIPAVRTLKDHIGVNTFVRRAKSTFGFSSDLPAVYSLALGSAEMNPLEVAEGYSVFQRGGTRVQPFGIKKIRMRDGEDVHSFGPNPVSSQLRSSTCEFIDDCLRGVVRGGTATAASYVRNARGKTGTTSDNKDAWFVGYTDELMGVGWIANETRDERKRVVYAPMDSDVMGGRYTAVLWARIMSKCQDMIGEERSNRSYESESSAPRSSRNEPADPSLESRSEEERQADTPEFAPETTEVPDPPAEEPTEQQQPPDQPQEEQNMTTTVMICADSGRLARDSCPEQTPRTYRKGREPKRYCSLHRG